MTKIKQFYARQFRRCVPSPIPNMQYVLNNFMVAEVQKRYNTVLSSHATQNNITKTKILNRIENKNQKTNNKYFKCTKDTLYKFTVVCIIFFPKMLTYYFYTSKFMYHSPTLVTFPL